MFGACVQAVATVERTVVWFLVNFVIPFQKDAHRRKKPQQRQNCGGCYATTTTATLRWSPRRRQSPGFGPLSSYKPLDRRCVRVDLGVCAVYHGTYLQCFRVEFRQLSRYFPSLFSEALKYHIERRTVPAMWRVYRCIGVYVYVCVIFKIDTCQFF